MHSCQLYRIFRLSLDDNKYVAGVFVDLKKAFDTVDHDIFIEKLDHYGVRGVAKDWFISYLKGRRQFVVIENETSSSQEILTGVPQGSALGPLLFLIYINDLNTCMQFSKTYQFTDDTNIMMSNISLEVLTKQINKDLLNLSYWLRAHKLCLNFQKTELIIFRPTSLKIDLAINFKLQGKRLISAHSVKYSGVLLDEHLQWTEQFSNVRIKLNRAIGILSKLRHNSKSRHLENNILLCYMCSAPYISCYSSLSSFYLILTILFPFCIFSLHIYTIIFCNISLYIILLKNSLLMIYITNFIQL